MAIADFPDIVDGWVNLPVSDREDLTRYPELARTMTFFGNDPDVLCRREPEALIDALDTAGVGQAYLTCPVTDGTRARLGRLSVDVEQGLELVQRYPDRLRVILDVDALGNGTDLAWVYARVRALAGDPRVAGVGVTPSLLGVDVNHAWLYPVYALCVERSLPVRINIGIIGPQLRSKHQHPLLLEEILVDFPDLTVIGAHVGQPWEKLVVRLLMKFPNMSVMTSAVMPQYLDPDMRKFMDSRRGRDRFMFASDWPVLDIKAAIDSARSLGLHDETVSAYLGGNARRILPWNR